MASPRMRWDQQLSYRTARGRFWHRASFDGYGEQADGQEWIFSDATANSGGLLPEQVWDDAAPSGTPGFAPGTPTLSATPLAWTHAQYLRLAQDIAQRRVSEEPAAVRQCYGG